MEVSHSAAAETTIQYSTPSVKTELIDYELPPILPKMENIPIFEETFTAHEEEAFEEKFLIQDEDESKVNLKTEDIHTEVDNVEFTEINEVMREETPTENPPKEITHVQQKESTQDLPKEGVKDQPAVVDEEVKTDDVNKDAEMKNEMKETPNLQTKNETV